MKKFIEEFKVFATRGNFVDLAVGVVMGSAVSNVVNSIVNDIFMPFITLITGKVSLSELCIVLNGENSINYGNLISTLVNFLLITLCMFLVVKIINRLMIKKQEAKEESVPVDSPELVELKKITSLLEKKSEL